jgi:Flp pilus assembly protein TadB
MYNLKQKVSLVVILIFLAVLIRLVIYFAFHYMPKWIDFVFIFTAFYFIVYYVSVWSLEVIETFKEDFPEDED